MGPDLHIHSTASDGVLDPELIVAEAARCGIPVIALADHDTVAGVSRALSIGAMVGVEVIPAVEISTESGGRQIHVLGYCVDHNDAHLNARLERQREHRVARATRICDALHQYGIDSVSFEDVLQSACGGSVGRTHVAYALMRRGHAASVPDAFERLLGEGRPCYVPKEVATPEEAIGWIQDAGGVAVLAHPFLSAVDDLIPGLVGAGLAGIEAYHAECPSEEVTRYVRLADGLGVLTTGGSDFHGNGHASTELGAGAVPVHVVERLLSACPRVRGVL